MRSLAVVFFLVVIFTNGAAGGDNALGFKPVVNEVSLFQNLADGGQRLGQTLQIVSINSIKLGTWFNLEFTADFNRKLNEGQETDYYIEIGLVKPIWKRLSANYQRVEGTFVSEPFSQFGLRWSF